MKKVTKEGRLVKTFSFKSKWFFVFIVLSIFLASINSVLGAPVVFSGYTYNTTEGAINATNVTLELWQESPWSASSSYSNISNASGYWSVTIDSANLSGKMVKFIPRHYNGPNVDFIGGILPPFPYTEISAMLNLSAINFYLKEGATINISAVNSSGENINFTYMLKDVKLGFPVESEWQNSVLQKTFYVVADRNYSIEIFPTQAMPVFYNLNNLSAYGAPKTVNITFNTTTQPIGATGRFNLSNGTGAFDEINIVSYLLEPGNMVFASEPMPYNMSAWDGSSDIYNATAGTYNISLQGTAMTSNVLLFAVGRIGTGYYGGFRNISPTINGGNIDDFNFTLFKLLGSPANISISMPTSTAKINVTAGQTLFAFVNSSGSALTTATAHLEVELDYSTLNSQMPDFTWMVDVEQGGGGTFKLPLLNHSVKKLNMFTQSYAPLKLKYTAAQLSVSQVNVTLRAFNPGGVDTDFSGIQMRMMKSSAACDVPVPPTSCDFATSADQEEDNFKPLNAVISGGQISLRIKSGNITVHYKNVDMIASGPPDAAFDNSANQSTAGSSLDQAWRFGSSGPEIYDSVLVGIPYDGSTVDESASIRILVNKLYDQDWNVVWSIAQGNTSDSLPSDYSDFNRTWFNASSNGMFCDTSNVNADCFANTTTNMLWLKIPHFSGVGPTVKSITLSGVNANTTNATYECRENCSVYINVTNGNNTISLTLQNVTINNTETTGNVIWFRIYRYNNTAWVLNGTNSTNHINYNFTLNNGTSETVHQYRIDINKSTNAFTQWNFTYNVSGLSSPLVLTINLTCTESWSCGEWGTCSSGTQTRTCTDVNICGTTTSRPSLSKDCTTSTTTSSTGSSGGGPSTTAPAPTNIVSIVSRMWVSVSSGETATMPITSTSIGLTEVAVTVKNEVASVSIEVSSLKEKPVTTAAAAEVYQYLEVKPKNLANTDIDKATIKFKVTKSWLAEKGVAEKEVVLYRQADNKWNKLTTKVVSSDANNVYYEADTPGFSYFAIGTEAAPAPAAAEEGAAAAEEAAAEEKAEELTPPAKLPVVTPPPASKAWIGWLIAAIIIVTGIIIYTLTKKKKK